MIDYEVDSAQGIDIEHFLSLWLIRWHRARLTELQSLDAESVNDLWNVLLTEIANSGTKLKRVPKDSKLPLSLLCWLLEEEKCTLTANEFLSHLPLYCVRALTSLDWNSVVENISFVTNERIQKQARAIAAEPQKRLNLPRLPKPPKKPKPLKIYIAKNAEGIEKRFNTALEAAKHFGIIRQAIYSSIWAGKPHKGVHWSSEDVPVEQEQVTV